jgi:hypothetical protein
VFNNDVRMYFDGGATPQVMLFTDVRWAYGGEYDYFTLTGYLLDCTANCAAIQP